MKKTVRIFSLTFILAVLASAALAQGDAIRINVTPDHQDWLYKVGEPVNYNITVTKNKEPLKGVKIKYTLGFEKMQPYLTEETILKDGTLTVSARGMDTPGFLACRVFVEHEGEKVNQICQVGFEPERLRPMTVMPDDFEAYWQKVLDENAKMPLNPVMTYSEEFSTDKMDCWQVRIDNYRPGAHLYGYLAVPKGEGPFPAILYVPGAGVGKTRPNRTLVENGVITFQIGIHGIPFDMDEQVYADLKEGALRGYQYNNLDILDEYYYRRVFAGCVKAIDYIYSHPKFDGQRLAVSGGSQGGGLSIITTALDPRVKYFVSFYPAMCDHMGYLHNRAGGWPHMFDEARSFYRTAARIENSKYYDAANFARLLTVPGFFSWGYNDLSCPITSMYSAYNIITSPKELLVEPPNPHRRTKTQDAAAESWLLDKLGVLKK